MDKIVFYALFLIGFLVVLVIGAWIADTVIPRCKKLDAWLADLARQKKD